MNGLILLLGFLFAWYLSGIIFVWLGVKIESKIKPDAEQSRREQQVDY